MDLDCAEKIMPITMINIPTRTINSFKYDGMLSNLRMYMLSETQVSYSILIIARHF